MHSILVGTSVIAAFLAGVVALFAPCCVSVMLPAYLATGAHRRRGLVAMTFVFAAGVGAVILPIAFGAAVLSRAINGEHTVVYSTMAVAMIAMGLAMAGGARLRLPAPGGRARARSGPGATFVLGAFSGVATACCAPVLAGVVALSGAAASFVAALVVGVAYVFGMVAPLFVVALVWDGRDLGASRLLAGRSIGWRLGGHRWAVPLSSFAGGLLLIAMGVVVGILAVTGPDMATHGWQASLSGDAQHWAHLVTAWLGRLPGWVTAAVVFVALAALIAVAVHQVADPPDSDPPLVGTGAARPSTQDGEGAGGPSGLQGRADRPLQASAATAGSPEPAGREDR